MDGPGTRLTRRSFLSSVAAGSAALGAELVVPGSLLAASDPSNADGLNPNFVSGLLVDVAPGLLTVYAHGYGPPLAVRVTGETEVCRGSAFTISPYWWSVTGSTCRLSAAPEGSGLRGG
jgi:hypothetical protein